MFGPSLNTTHLANHRHHERLEHSARIQMVARHRRDSQRPINYEGARGLTAAPLMAAAAGAAKSVASALTGSSRASAGR